MDRKEQRKILSQLKKKKEEEIKLKLIEKYPHIHQLYKDGEITLKQAYDGSQSELLGVETFKSKGTKTFITHKTKIQKNPSTSTFPFSKHPMIENPKFNLVYEDILKMNFKVFKRFSLDLRTELLRIWKEDNIPPYVGKNREGIVDDFTKLKEHDISTLIMDGDDSYEYVIHNNYRYGSSCNQFTSALHKTKFDGTSLWDILSKEEHELRWIRKFTRNLKQDYAYEFSKRIYDKKDIPELIEDGWSLLPQKKSPIDDVIYSKKELQKMVKDGLIQKYHIENLGILHESETEFNIRKYKSDTKIFTHIIHLIRIGFSNTPTNFNPLIGRTIYEKFLDENTNHVVYDSSSGWGGRFLGAMISNRKIKYLGVDVNSHLFEPNNTYDELSKFLTDELDIKCDYSIKKMSSIRYRETEEYEKYKGKVSMILTSPPYYAKEEYSDDLEQSYIQFRSYKDWITMYLYTTFKIGYEMVKDGGYCLVNISDITIKSKHFELELDTIQTLEEIGWEYQYQIGMRMNRFIGLDAGKIVNRVMDKSKGNFMKVEPILVFKK